MRLKPFILPFLLVVLAALPVVLADRGDRAPRSARRVIIYTPHNEQIRSEFGRAFRAWHERNFGEPATVVWNTPGGTSEIRRILDANAAAALREGRPIGGNADLVFGGGSYEYGQLKRETVVGSGDDRRSGRILARPDFDPAWLAETYGANSIGDNTLYDPDGYWFGVALSGFGIVYNRDRLRDLGLDEPTEWSELADARLAGSVTLVNPAQSGSVKTALEAIIQRLGWERGWQIIRRMSANARSVASSAPKVPLDVSSGDSAAGPCIDFYGRYQAQAIRDAGDPDRLGYVDPPGQTVIDPDPIALLANAPNKETAERFIRFALSDQGQALWQFRAEEREDGALGPREFELRRMPVRRSFIERHSAGFIDQVDPFTLASAVRDPDPNARNFIAPLFSAVCADRRSELARAWRAIREHPAYPAPASGRGMLVTAADVSDPTLKAMLEAFDAMPSVRAPDGTLHDLATREGRAAVAAGYLAKNPAWAGTGLWLDGSSPADELRRLLGAAVAERYAEVVRLSEEGVGGAGRR
jgi:ABC-type Fe3+ transport system substrate-binding protein